jgi:hypothetical protein
LVTVSPDPDRTCLAKSFFFSWSCKIFSSTVPSQTNLKSKQISYQKPKVAYLITHSSLQMLQFLGELSSLKFS